MKGKQLCFVKEKETSYKFVENNLLSEVREKVARYGTDALSNTELVFCLINGKKNSSNLEIANKLLENDGLRYLETASLEVLEKLVGEVKAIELKVALELGKRMKNSKSGYQNKISRPKDAADILMEDMRYLQQEHLKVMYLNTKNVVIGEETVFVGGLNSSVVHPREIFAGALNKRAAFIIVAHNHPSGDSSPSQEDINVTNRLNECGKLLGIKVLDHIIIGDGVFVSLKEKGVL